MWFLFLHMYFLYILGSNLTISSAMVPSSSHGYVIIFCVFNVLYCVFNFIFRVFLFTIVTVTYICLFMSMLHYCDIEIVAFMLVLHSCDCFVIVLYVTKLQLAEFVVINFDPVTMVRRLSVGCMTSFSGKQFSPNMVFLYNFND